MIDHSAAENLFDLADSGTYRAGGRRNHQRFTRFRKAYFRQATRCGESRHPGDPRAQDGCSGFMPREVILSVLRPPFQGSTDFVRYRFPGLHPGLALAGPLALILLCKAAAEGELRIGLAWAGRLALILLQHLVNGFRAVSLFL